MTWWMILLLIFAILFLIGCIPVGAAVDYQDEALAVRAKIGPFGIQILPKREKKAKKIAKSTQKSDKKTSTEAKKSEKKPSAFLSGDVGALFDLLRLVCDTLGNLRRKIRVELLVLHVTYGGDDPAQAAINYGRSWAVIGALNVIGVRVIDHLIFAGNSVYSMTQNSQFDGRQSGEEISYLMRSRNVPGRRGTLREEQEDELVALKMNP